MELMAAHWLVGGGDVTCSLIAPNESHLPQLLAWHNDKQLMSTVLGYLMPVGEQEVLNWLSEQAENVTRCSWVITVDSVPVGVGTLRHIDWIARHAEVGLYVGVAEYRGRGVGTQALNALRTYAYEQLNLRRLSCRIRADNLAALALFGSAGFEEEGVLRGAAYSVGRHVDVKLLGHLRDE